MECNSEKFQLGQIEFLTKNREGINATQVQKPSSHSQTEQMHNRQYSSAARKCFRYRKLLEQNTTSPHFTYKYT